MKDTNEIINYTKAQMEMSLTHLKNELSKVRAGKATPALLDGIMVDYYGSKTPLSQVANVNTPDSRTISIQPWEKSMIDPIEKAISAANIGLAPQNNGDIVMLNVPPLTEERRKNLVKQAKGEGEHAKVSIRNTRKEANDLIKKLAKDGLAEDLAKAAETQIQKLTDDYSVKIDATVVAKEKDIMTV